MTVTRGALAPEPTRERPGAWWWGPLAGVKRASAFANRQVTEGRWHNALSGNTTKEREMSDIETEKEGKRGREGEGEGENE